MVSVQSEIWKRLIAMSEESTEQDNPEQESERFVDGDSETIIDTAKRLVWLKQDTWQMSKKWMTVSYTHLTLPTILLV